MYRWAKNTFSIHVKQYSKEFCFNICTVDRCEPFIFLATSLSLSLCLTLAHSFHLTSQAGNGSNKTAWYVLNAVTYALGVAKVKKWKLSESKCKMKRETIAKRNHIMERAAVTQCNAHRVTNRLEIFERKKMYTKAFRGQMGSFWLHGPWNWWRGYMNYENMNLFAFTYSAIAVLHIHILLLLLFSSTVSHLAFQARLDNDLHVVVTFGS